MNKFHIGSVAVMMGDQRDLYFSLLLIRVSICAENIGLWCFRVITRPVRSTRVPSTSGRRSFAFMAFLLRDNQRRALTHTGGCTHVCTTTKFRRCFTPFVEWTFLQRRDAINSFPWRVLVDPWFPERLYWPIFHAAPYSRNSRILYLVCESRKQILTGATPRRRCRNRRGSSNDDKRRMDYHPTPILPDWTVLLSIQNVRSREIVLEK